MKLEVTDFFSKDLYPFLSLLKAIKKAKSKTRQKGDRDSFTFMHKKLS